MLTNNPKGLVQWSIAALVLIPIVFLLISTLFTWLNTGILRITTPGDVRLTKIQYCQTTCTTTTYNPIKIPKGDYLVEAELSDGTLFSTPATVRGSNEETKVEATSKLYTPTVFSMNTMRYTLPIPGSYISYSPNLHRIIVGDKSVTLPLKSIIRAQYIDEHTIAFVGPKYENTSQQNVIYDTRTKKVSVLPNSYDFDTGNLSTGSDALYASSFSNNHLSIIKISTTTQKIDIPSIVSGSISNIASPMFAVNGGVFAVLSKSLDRNEQVINTYSLKDFSKISSIRSNIRGGISGLSLSPDGKTVVELANESFSYVYDTTSGAERFKMYSDGPVVWLDDDSLIYTSNISDSAKAYSAGGVYRASVKNSSAQSIIQRSTISNVRLDAVVGGKVYLSSATPSTGDYRFISYAIDLTKSGGPTLSPEQAAVLNKLPYSTSTYSIWYTIDDKAVVTIHSKITAGSKNAVIATLHRLGFNPANYPIVFDNAPNPFEEEKQ